VGRQGKISDEQKRQALREREAGASLDELTKRYGVTKAAIYQWRDRFAKEMGPAIQGGLKSRLESLKKAETVEQKVSRLERENEQLRKRLFDLMIETGRL
jgi:transposase-like protein